MSADAREAERGEAEVFFVIVLGILALAAFGGYRLWTEWSGVSGDCYFYMKTPGNQLCVLAKSPGRDCISTQQFPSYFEASLACFEDGQAGRAASFVRDSGKKVCGQFIVDPSCR